MSSAGLDHCADATIVTRPRTIHPSTFFMPSIINPARAQTHPNELTKGMRAATAMQDEDGLGKEQKKAACTVLCTCREASDATCVNPGERLRNLTGGYSRTRW